MLYIVNLVRSICHHKGLL